MLKKIIKCTLQRAGLQLSRINTLERLISTGQFKWLQEYGIKTVVDVGAYVGSFATMIHKVLPEASIYSFEPLNESYQTLLTNTKHIKHMKCFNVALGSHNGSAVIHRNEFSPSSSLLRMAQLHKNTFPYTNKEVDETIQIARLDSFSGDIIWNRNTLLKIDVQGYELEVLKGMGALIDIIDLIIIETSFVELYSAQPLFTEVYSFLNGKEFKYAGNLEQLTDPRTGRILQADAIFIRS